MPLDKDQNKDPKATDTPEQPATEEKPAAKSGDGDDLGTENVDPRLDNRTGGQRPPLEEFPAKPQQVDGPEVTDEPDRDARPHEVSDDRPRKGMQSPGPHGLGGTSVQSS